MKKKAVLTIWKQSDINELRSRLVTCEACRCIVNPGHDYNNHFAKNHPIRVSMGGFHLPIIENGIDPLNSPRG